MATVELTGGKAVIAAIIGAVVFATNYFAAAADFDREGEKLVQREIYYEYLRHAQAEDNKAGNHDKARALGRQEDIKLTAISARGPRDDTVVRVDVAPHPAEPSSVEHVRYYVMTHSLLTGWSLKRETRGFTYYSKFF